MIYISSDHAGFKLKNKLVNYFKRVNLDINDLGPFEYIKNDDYPDYVKPLVDKVLESSENRGILICKNGVGVNVAANRNKSIRAALSWNERHAKSSRTDDDSNILCLPADFICFKKAKNIINTWLNTPFSSLDRHLRRLSKL